MARRVMLVKRVSQDPCGPTLMISIAMIVMSQAAACFLGMVARSVMPYEQVVTRGMMDKEQTRVRRPRWPRNRVARWTALSVRSVWADGVKPRLLGSKEKGGHLLAVSAFLAVQRYQREATLLEYLSQALRLTDG